MCKHEFKLVEKPTVVVTYCKKCGIIGDVHELSPFHQYTLYPMYPIYSDPYYPWNWTTTPGSTGVDSTGDNHWTLNDATSGTLTGCDYANTTDETSETVWMLDLDTGSLTRCK